MNDTILLFHMLSLIADAYQGLQGRIVTMPSGRRFLPGDAVNEFLLSLEETLDMQSEISEATREQYINLPAPDLSKLN